MPSPRPRVVVRGRFPTVYLPKEYMTWKAELAESVKAADHLPTEDEKGQPCAVFVVVKVAKPKTTKLSHPAPDVDNYAKGVLDAITQSEAWWDDDKQVTDLQIVKRWADPGEEPGFFVTITFT